MIAMGRAPRPRPGSDRDGSPPRGNGDRHGPDRERTPRVNLADEWNIGTPEKEEMREIKEQIREMRDNMMSKADAEAMVISAVTKANEMAAMRMADEPPWAKRMRESMQTKIGEIENGLNTLKLNNETVQKRLFSIESGGAYSIFLAEEAAKETTSHQSRIFGLAQIQDLKGKVDQMCTEYQVAKPVEVAKSGAACVVSFKDAKTAKAFARSFREAKPTEAGKPLSIRPQLPPSVLESQGQLQRALFALKNARSADAPKVHVWCDFKERVVTDGVNVFARQWMNGHVVPIDGSTDPSTLAAMREAVADREYIFKFKGGEGKGGAEKGGKGGGGGPPPANGKGNAADAAPPRPSRPAPSPMDEDKEGETPGAGAFGEESPDRPKKSKGKGKGKEKGGGKGGKPGPQSDIRK